MSLKDIQAQLQLSRNALLEMQKQNTIFESTLKESLKGAPEKDKKEVDRVKALALKVQRLAKQGKVQEAQSLIKEFKYGGKNN